MQRPFGRKRGCRRRTIAVLVVLVATAMTAPSGVAAGSQTGSQLGPGVSYADAPCPSPNIEGVPQLDLGPEFTCGYLTAPESRADPDGPKIKIAVARVKAASPSPKPDPIIWLEGGPGGTGLAAAPRVVEEGLNRDRDMIFIDQRGTLHAEPLLSCPEIDAFAVESFGLAPTDASTRKRHVAATKACHDRLVADGFDLAAFNTAENAADVADLRVALGIEEWDLYGVSYGTYLALSVLRDHPEGIRSLVLDSLVPLQNNLVAGFWPAAADGFDALFTACVAQPACNAAYPDLEREFSDTVRKLQRQPMTVEVPDPAGGPDQTVVFDGYQLANLLVTQSLAPGSFVDVPAMIHDVAEGDATAAATALLAQAPPPGLTGYGLTYGVFCRESVPFTNPRQVAKRARAAFPTFPKKVLELVPQLTQPFGDCGVWDVGRARKAIYDVPSSDVPVLLLSGTFDAITPTSWAIDARKGLSNSKVVRIPAVGHDVLLWSECAREVAIDFLDDPAAPTAPCVADLEVPEFTTT